MRLIIIILFFSLNATATNYYISNTGSNAANGTSTGTAWQTIAKVNSVTFAAGDSVLFKRGDSWNERLNFPSSGTSVSPIIIAAYGTGADPIITGLQTISLTQNGNIWSTVATSSVPKLNTVLVNGQLKAKGRYPNSGYLTFTSYSGTTQITGSLTGTPNYTGCEIVVRTAHWVIDVSKVTSQSGGTLNFSPAITYTPALYGNGYFLQNDSTLLDANGEWYFDSTTKKFGVYSTTTPTVQISSIDTLVWLSQKNYLTFDNITFTGANMAAFQLDTSRHITIQNCSINYSGTLGISGEKSEYATVSNDSIQNSLSGAIYFRSIQVPMEDTCNYSTITGNYIKNTGIYAGMGLSGNVRYNGISVIGLQPTITNNTVDSTGYIGISFIGTSSYVYRNYVTNYCFVKDDGAGIYTVVGSSVPATYNNGGIVRSNIVVNCIGANAGTSTVIFPIGIYLDDDSRYVTVDSNFIYKAGGYLHNASYITWRENTIVDSLGDAMRVNAGGTTGTSIKKNVFYSQKSTSYCIQVTSSLPGYSVDSNYYSRPTAESTKFRSVNTTTDLAGWVVATGYDTHSAETPSGITAALPLIYYNATTSAIVSNLTGAYISAKGVTYNNSITLQPFTSAILFKATNEIPVTDRIRNKGFTIIR